MAFVVPQSGQNKILVVLGCLLVAGIEYALIASLLPGLLGAIYTIFKYLAPFISIGLAIWAWLYVKNNFSENGCALFVGVLVLIVFCVTLVLNSMKFIIYPTGDDSNNYIKQDTSEYIYQPDTSIVNASPALKMMR